MTRTTRRSAIVALTTGVLLLAACGADDGPAAQPTTAPIPAIDGRTYLSESVSGHGLVAGSTLQLSFDGTDLGASAGCNQMFGTYDIADGNLAVRGMGMTEMACDPALMDQEQWFAEFLADTPSIEQDGDRLTLTSADVTVVMIDREVADPDRPLEGTTWDVTGAFDGASASSVPAGGSVTFADGTVEVDTGCNTGSGTYELGDAGTMTVGPISLTRMACVDPDAARLEQTMIDVLQGDVTYEVDAASLTITRGQIGLQLTASE